MRKLMNNKYYILFVICLIISCKEITWGGLGNDINLWRDTEIWDFANCVSNGDFNKAEVLLSGCKIDIDFKEPKYGETLLSWAVQNDNIEAVTFLVDHGANPNAHDSYNGKSPMVIAAEEFNSPEILKYLLNHGGNPNDHVNEGEHLTNGRSSYTPLIGAAFVSLEKTKMLVNAGADPNFAVEPGYTSYTHAAMRTQMDILEFLLKNCKMDYKKSFIVTLDTKDTLYLKEIIKKDDAICKMDSARYNRILNYLDKKYGNCD